MQLDGKQIRHAFETGGPERLALTVSVLFFAAYTGAGKQLTDAGELARGLAECQLAAAYWLGYADGAGWTPGDMSNGESEATENE